ncbi:hypothetical protein FRC19_004200 [Serendipita sp. 401]|nr:hypothetical protein FRC19_004200 [Serendipita sp. 401]KAG9055094.1 hypothetical protein FS842_003136 [Serendipita sp. 407]
MGLAGRKEKQRIGKDPRNLTWAEDDSRFGQQYLAKFGWTPDSGTGLGANGDGRLKHISVAQKLNLLGIGNNQNSGGPDAIAWKQNRDFENVLKKLNGTDIAEGVTDMQEVKIEPALLRGFVRPEMTNEKVSLKPQVEGQDAPQEKPRRKGNKKSKSTSGEEKEVERIGKGESPVGGESNIEEDLSSKQTQSTKPTPHLAHRAKFRKSKQMASLSAAALNEILGVSNSTTPSTSNVASHLATPVPVTPQEPSTPNPQQTNKTPVIEENLTISTKSVADYFTAKLKERRSQLSTPLPEENATPETHVSTPDLPMQEDRARKLSKKEKKRKREQTVEDADREVEDSAEPTVNVEESSSPEVEKKKKKKKRKEDTTLDEAHTSERRKKKRSKDRD